LQKVGNSGIFVSKQQKAIDRLLARPTDFEWGELKSLMEAFGYEMKTAGGSGRKFVHPDSKLTLFIHEPHPARVLKAYQVRDLIDFLKQEKRLP
jgi:hypothetical protein